MTGTREIHDKAKRSLWLVLSRQGLVALLSFASGVVLARSLAPADFGVFAVATFVVVFAGMVADLGLTAALIQKPSEPSTLELRAAFAAQQLAAVVAFAVLWASAGLLSRLYPQAPPELVGMVRLMSADLFLLSWCRPSEALLERSLRYERLAPIDVAVTAVYAVMAIVLAASGVGVWSFGIAWVASTLTRLVLVFRASPWAVGLAWNWPVAREILRAGAPLQLSRVVAQAQYWITPTVVAATIGPAAAGLLQWAAGNARKPLDALENVARVSLPHFSRLQHDEMEVRETLGRYVTGFVAISALWLAVVAIAGTDLVRFIYTDRWLAAVPAMILFAAAALLASVRVIVTTALAGVGQSRLIGRMTVWGAVATILASIALVPRFGMLGVPLGQLLGTAAILPALVRGLGSGGAASVRRGVVPAVAPAIVAVAAGLGIRYSPLSPDARGFATAAVMALAFGATLWLGGPRWLRLRHSERPSVSEGVESLP